MSTGLHALVSLLLIVVQATATLAAIYLGYRLLYLLTIGRDQ